ncbi:MAG TPA: alkaline phosphatase family protein, partial [Planctomycetota bacterium]|nr:alkaline phosphatase family protein [Planctomycetota bacterium]
MFHRKLLVVQVAALGYEFLKREINAKWKELEFRPLEPTFPAVTCTVQASFRTASPPGAHGMVANGIFHEELQRPMFWEQSSRLVSGARIWDGLRKRGKRVAMLFWQQSLGADVDLVLSPAPIHKHHGGMIPDCYGKPAYLYEHLCSAVGHQFSLAHYWGPLASSKSGDWIANATAALLSDNDLAPDLCLTYLPTLDYDLQRHGPDHDRSVRALEALVGQFNTLVEAAQRHDYHVLFYGDYAIGAVEGEAVFPNRALSDAGLLHTRQIKHMLYPDFYRSRAFALVDHEIAHVIIDDPDDLALARQCLGSLEGVGEVLDREAMRKVGVDHARSGELLLVAAPGRWFAYPWWR